MHDMDWTHYDGAERAMSEAKQMILVLDFDQRSSSRCLETESRLQGQKRIKYNEARI